MLHLARHGHVENPKGLLYGNLAGFVLSATGRSQATALGDHIRRRGLRFSAVYSSPLERATETAFIATGRVAATDPALVDWEPAPEWVGLPWDRIPWEFPELWARFRTAPWIDGTGAAAALRRIASVHTGRDVLVVGHQDPLRAALLSLGASPGGSLRDDPLPQCGIRTVDPRRWRIVERWDPPASTGWPTATL